MTEQPPTSPNQDQPGSGNPSRRNWLVWLGAVGIATVLGGIQFTRGHNDESEKTLYRLFAFASKIKNSNEGIAAAKSNSNSVFIDSATFLSIAENLGIGVGQLDLYRKDAKRFLDKGSLSVLANGFFKIDLVDGKNEENKFLLIKSARETASGAEVEIDLEALEIAIDLRRRFRTGEKFKMKAAGSDRKIEVKYDAGKENRILGGGVVR